MEFRNWRKLITCSLFIIFLVSCTNADNKDVNDSDILEDDMVNETDTIEHDIDYRSFSKKIWINESSEQQDSIDELFLYLNKIDSDNVEGEIFIGKMPISSYYYYNPPFSEKYPWNLIGTVKGDSVECELVGEEMNGHISLVLNNAYIEGSVELTNEVVLNDKFIDEGAYKFRPYTINDVTLKYEEMGISTTLLDEYSYEVYIDTWGKVDFKAMMINGNKSHPAFFLTNEENEILYQLDAPFQNGLDVTETSIDDIDRDGLEDIIVILGDKDTSIGGVVAWIFFQTEDGVFSVSNEVQKDLNIEYYDKTHLDTETIKEYFEVK